MTPASLDAKPVQPGERAVLIDVLRGFALLGILIVNFWGLFGDRFPGMDRAVDVGIETLAEESFYPLFSFLFGLGFGIQLLRARERGAGVRHLYLRRMLVLFLIGTAHWVLIWNGDILVLYSTLGLLLIPFFLLPPKALLTAAAIIFATVIFDDRITEMATGLESEEEIRAEELDEGVTAEQNRAADAVATRDGGGPRETYASDVGFRWRQLGFRMGQTLDPMFYVGQEILMLFLIGMYVARRRFLFEAGSHRRGLAWTAALGAAAAIAGNLLLERFESGALNALAYTGANFGVTAFYIGGIALLVSGGGAFGRRLTIFAPVGRMALTNYLMQSLVMTWPFLSYGLGFEEPSTTGWLVLNLIFFFGVQVPLSHYWMARFRYGPVEWAWRSLTYGRIEPFRLPREVAPEATPLAPALP